MVDFGRVGDFFGDVIEGATEAPEDLRKFAEQLESDQIEAAQDFKTQIQQSGDQAAENLRRSKYQSTGANVGGWLSKPKNLIMAAAAIFGIFWLVNKA